MQKDLQISHCAIAMPLDKTNRDGLLGFVRTLGRDGVGESEG